MPQYNSAISQQRNISVTPFCQDWGKNKADDTGIVMIHAVHPESWPSPGLVDTMVSHVGLRIDRTMPVDSAILLQKLVSPRC